MLFLEINFIFYYKYLKLFEIIFYKLFEKEIHEIRI